MLLYAVTVFLSAFLLFQLQPLIGRYLLPWFGGTPGVWTTCLLFFQTVLFVGIAAPLIFDGYREYPAGLLLCGALLIGLLGRDAKAPILRTLLVRAGNASLGLTNGRIQHGFQYQAPGKRGQPTSYHGEESGVGRALLHDPRREASLGLRIGVVGLGVGTLAAYVQPGDVIGSYEINPDVIALSRGRAPRFTFLADAPGHVEVVEGDARLSLERELARHEPGRFDLLVLDAFSSDAVPVHLLTVEAFATYLEHLRDADAILAVHASNRHVRLHPVLLGIAERFGLAAVECDTKPDGHADPRSVWVLMSRRPEVLGRPGIAEASVRLTGHGRRVPLWTDDDSDLFGTVVW
ncbi:MAG: spermidine synthase [Acidithiobacillales bacterium]